MSKEYFVDEQSIVRQIWGKADTILFIFAGAAAEFALNKAVDWLYYTGRLPSDPLGRLFSTVAYARTIVFSEQRSAMRAIDAMSAIHADLEAKRGSSIPDWAYRDVLFLLIDYSIRSFEMLERSLTAAEKQEVFAVFNRVGARMGLQGLPDSFASWEQMRRQHLLQDLEPSPYSLDLYRQYRKQLGPVRFRILRMVQALLVPQPVGELLGLHNRTASSILIGAYRTCRSLRLDGSLKALLLPSTYKKEIKALDSAPKKMASCPFRSGRKAGSAAIAKH